MRFTKLVFLLIVSGLFLPQTGGASEIELDSFGNEYVEISYSVQAGKWFLDPGARHRLVQQGVTTPRVNSLLKMLGQRRLAIGPMAGAEYGITDDRRLVSTLVPGIEYDHARFVIEAFILAVVQQENFAASNISTYYPIDENSIIDLNVADPVAGDAVVSLSTKELEMDPSSEGGTEFQVALLAQQILTETNSGVRLEIDDSGGVVAIEDIRLASGQIVIEQTNTERILSSLEQTGEINSRNVAYTPLIGETWSAVEEILNSLGGSVDSINPGHIVPSQVVFPKVLAALLSQRKVPPNDPPGVTIVKALFDAFVVGSQTWNDHPCAGKARNDFYEKLEQHVAVVPGFLATWNETKENRDIARQFDQACFEKINAASIVFDADTDNRVAFITKAAFGSVRFPVCGAFRVSEKRFITARHCAPPNGFNALYRVHLLGDVSKSTPIVRVHGNGTRDVDAADDLIAFDVEPLKLAKISNKNLDEVIGTPGLWSEVQLPGFYAFYEHTGMAISGGWKHGLRKTRADDTKYSHCRIVDISRNAEDSKRSCIFHGCQSIGIFSGSPLLQKTSSGSFEIIGIHVEGHATNPKRGCPNPYIVGKIRGNGGVDQASHAGENAGIAALVSPAIVKSLELKKGKKP